MRPGLDDADVVVSGFELLELLVSLLPDNISPLVIKYMYSRHVLTNFMSIPDLPAAPHICLVLQQSHLSMVAVLFQKYQCTLVPVGLHVVSWRALVAILSPWSRI
jgi:hypothetical protein